MSRFFYIWYFTCYFSLFSFIHFTGNWRSEMLVLSARCLSPISQLSPASFTHCGQALKIPIEQIFHIGETYSINHQYFKRIIILITLEIQFPVPSFLKYTIQSTPIFTESEPTQWTSTIVRGWGAMFRRLLKSPELFPGHQILFFVSACHSQLPFTGTITGSLWLLIFVFIVNTVDWVKVQVYLHLTDRKKSPGWPSVRYLGHCPACPCSG